MAARTPTSQPTVRTLLVGLLLLLIGLGAYYFHGSGHAGSSSKKAFFTIDDGKTWFVSGTTMLPPFEINGKEALGAHVYRCANGTIFVNDLERFTPDTKRILEDAASPSPSAHASPAAVRMAYSAGRQVKRPGDSLWIEADLPAASQVLVARGSNGCVDAVPVEP